MKKIEAEYVAFEEAYIHHEGDERSRTNPGHGYPAHTETLTKPVFLKNIEDVRAHIRSGELYNRNAEYQVFKLTPVRINRKIEIEIGD